MPWMRILNRSVLQVSEGYYQVTMEMTRAAPACTIAFVQSANGGPEGGVSTSFARADLPSAPTPGNLLVAWCLHRHNAGTIEPVGFTAVTPGYVSIPTEDDGTPSATEINRARLYYRIAEVGDTAAIMAAITASGAVHMFVAEFSGCDSWALDDFDSLTDDTDGNGPTSRTLSGGTVTPTDGPTLLVAGFGESGGAPGTFTPAADYTTIATSYTTNDEPLGVFVYGIVDEPSGNYTPSGDYTFPSGISRGSGGSVAAFRTS